jgi:mono/diheme cytochrome c family protein
MFIVGVAWACFTLQVVADSGRAVDDRSATPAPASDLMPVAQQNALVQKHCVGCHKGAAPGGGLSLEAFDAGRPDPSVAGMMLVKIAADGAMGAAGVPKPDAPTMDAFIGALSTAAASAPSGPGVWSVTLAEEPKRGHDLVTARITQEIPLPDGKRQFAVYQLTLACSGATRRGEMQLATFTKAGEDAPMTIRAMSTLANAAVPFTYALDDGVSQPATLRTTQEHSGTAQDAMLLPSRTLAVSGLYPKENVSFAFAGLSPTVRQVLATCFTAPPADR